MNNPEPSNKNRALIIIALVIAVLNTFAVAGVAVWLDRQQRDQTAWTNGEFTRVNELNQAFNKRLAERETIDRKFKELEKSVADAVQMLQQQRADMDKFYQKVITAPTFEGLAANVSSSAAAQKDLAATVNNLKGDVAKLSDYIATQIYPTVVKLHEEVRAHPKPSTLLPEAEHDGIPVGQEVSVERISPATMGAPRTEEQPSNPAVSVQAGEVSRVRPRN